MISISFIVLFCAFRLRSPRSVSPQRPTQTSRPQSRNVSPSFADSTFSAVHAALNKRQVQVLNSYFNRLFHSLNLFLFPIFWLTKNKNVPYVIRLDFTSLEA